MEYLIYKIEIFRYFDKTEEIDKLKICVDNYQNKILELKSAPIILPFFYTLYIDYPILKEYAGSFADLLFQEPDEAVEILNKIIETCIINMGINGITSTHINTQLRISCSPLVSNGLENINLKYALFPIRGILSGRSVASKYMKSAIYLCVNEKCTEKQSELVFGSGLPKNCTECNQMKLELVKARYSGDRVFGMIIDQNQFNKSVRCQGITVEFQDDLCSELILGVVYDVIIKRCRNGFCAWGIQKVIPPINQMYVRITPKIAYVYDQIREHCGRSPWSFANFIASQLYSESFPVTAFIQLKTALLLSLVSVHGEFPVPILALGDCSRLMTSLIKLSKYSINPIMSLSTPPTGEIIIDGKNVWLEAGPLLLGSKGVLYAGNMNKSNSNKFKNIISAVESEMVTLCHKTVCSTFDSSILTYPLKTAVWIHWNFMKSNQQANQLKTLINVFGMPFLSEIGIEEENICSYLINQAQGNLSDKAILDKTTLKELIEIASAQDVEMSQFAEELIRNYFVSSRRERSLALPVKSIKIISALAEAHARISMRKVVTHEDVIAVIFLYEETISHLFGPCLIIPGPKRVSDAQDSFEYVRQMDITLSEFSQWVEKYIKIIMMAGTTQS